MSADHIFENSFFQNKRKKINSKLINIPDVKHAEIYATSIDLTEVSFEEGFIKKARQKIHSGIGLRLIDGSGREGMTHTSDFSNKALERIISDGIKMMKVATPNPNFKDIAHPSKSYQTVHGLYDPQIENMEIDSLNDFIDPIFSLKKQDLPPRSLSGDFNHSKSATYVWNTNGIEKMELDSNFSINTNLSLVKKGITSSGFDWHSVSQLNDLNPEKVATNAYQMAKRGLIKTYIESGEYPLILSPIGVASFLLDPLTGGINSEKIQHNMSFLGGKLDKQIGAENFTVTDDPHVEGKLGTESFDAEGTATQKINIIENGILQNFYHNSYTANKEGKESNGHAARGSYAGNVSISNNNLIVNPGLKTKDAIIGEIKRGIYLEYTGDSPNLVTGDFSGLIMTGYLIEDGQIGPAVMETLLGINLMDAYARISEISKERIWLNECLVPWIKLDNVSISGRG